jgi:hypothetical protein
MRCLIPYPGSGYAGVMSAVYPYVALWQLAAHSIRRVSVPNLATKTSVSRKPNEKHPYPVQCFFHLRFPIFGLKFGFLM